MSEKDVTTGYVMPPWLWEPAPGTAAAEFTRQAEADAQQAEILDWAMGRIERTAR